MNAVQPDLFGGTGEEEREAQTEVRFPPNPRDGLVHLLAEVTTDRGSRIVKVRCGASMATFRTRDRLAGAFGWASVVTCPDPRCNPGKETHQ